jgi:hypothetical protein
MTVRGVGDLAKFLPDVCEDSGHGEAWLGKIYLISEEIIFVRGIYIKLCDNMGTFTAFLCPGCGT